MSGRDIVMIVSGFPRCSETFALGELLALEERGALTAIFATKPGDEGAAQPGCERLLERVRVLPKASAAQQAEFIVDSLKGQKVSGVHGYFAHTPALVAALTASRLGVPYGFSVHARDARKVAPDELALRAQGAACVVACNTDVAEDILRSGAPVHLLPHGVDLQRFRPQPSSSKVGPLRLLAVGRLVEKKGFHVLLEAVARLKSPYQLRIIGEGPERARLTGMIAARGLSRRVTLDGGMTHARLPEAYGRAQVVAVPSIQDRSGDRDGLPNVVLEALACGRPVVASRISAIGSVISHGETGLLVPPGDPLALADALERLAARPATRERMGRNGRARVERDYEVGRCTEQLYHLMRTVYA